MMGAQDWNNYTKYSFKTSVSETLKSMPWSGIRLTNKGRIKTQFTESTNFFFKITQIVVLVFLHFVAINSSHRDIALILVLNYS